MRILRRRRLPNALLGVILIIAVAIASVLAYTKDLPYVGAKYKVQAVFETSSGIRPDSPVRIAGVEVGKVTEVEHLEKAEQLTEEFGAEDPDAGGQQSVPEDAALVTMELDETARPIRTDAQLKLRPRLFLEGNLFVDLKPGSPNAPEADDGHVFQPDQTAVAVQLDEVLTTLQSDVRANLQTLLHEFGDALIRHGGAEGFRELYRTSSGAFRYGSEVNEALLGTEPGDLSDLIVNLDSTVEALGRNGEDLQDLVTNLRIVMGSFAAESAALQQGIAELPRLLEEGEPALASLNSAFPSLRAFAREALPGVRSTPATLDAATPLLRQVRGLMSERELRGLVADLRPAIPDLARLSRETIPFLNEARALSSCFNEVIIPWSNMTVHDPETPATGNVYEELGYGLVGLNGESRSGDANGQYIRVQTGGGLNTVVLPDTVNENGGVHDAVGMTPLPILGARPAIGSSVKTPFRPDAPCERQEQPNLDSGQAGAGPQTSPASAPQPAGDTSGLADAMEPLARRAQRIDKLTRGDAPKRELRGLEIKQRHWDALNEALASVYGLEQVLSRLEEYER